jgi:pimeloyl-ACP methyl ester carboxylesterase
MKNYILVHGAWGAAWEFSELSEIMTKSDVKVTAIDLPGHGKNAMPVQEVTMESYVQAVIDAVTSTEGSVVLVGHSLAGAVISQVAERIPHKIESLIFVAAILPANGQSPMDLMQSDEGGQLLPNVVFSEDQTRATITAATVENVLLNDMADKQKLASLTPHFLFEQSTLPFMAPAKLSQENFGAVKKFYIRAEVDKVLTPTLQSVMLQSWKMDGIFSLESGHFPMNTIAFELAETLKLAK